MDSYRLLGYGHSDRKFPAKTLNLRESLVISKKLDPFPLKPTHTLFDCWLYDVGDTFEMLTLQNFLWWL